MLRLDLSSQRQTSISDFQPSSEVEPSNTASSRALLSDAVVHPRTSLSTPPAAQLTEAAYGRRKELEFTPIPSYDQSPSRGQSVASVAASFEGRQLWKESKYRKDTENGLLGCAASESIVLQKAGYRYADAETVGQLYNQLKSHGWQVVDAKDRQPNDLMFAYKSGAKNWKDGGGSAHIGTVAGDGEIWNNSSRQGETWAKEPAEVAFGSYDRFRVLRPPSEK